jgi:hypothetical protein
MFTFGLVSCLEGGSNVQSRSGVPGIVKEVDQKLLITAPDFYPLDLYDANIQSLGFKNGDCVIFGYSVDFNDESNANYQTTNILQVGITNITLIDRYPCVSSMVYDTASLIENEQAISYAISSGGGNTLYFSDVLFLSSDISVNTEQKTRWYLYYDSDLPTKDIDGNTVYSLFLRAEIIEQGKAPVINGYATNAFDTKRFIETISSLEKTKGKDKAYFQIHHINEIKDDGTFTWAQSEVLPIGIAE